MPMSGTIYEVKESEGNEEQTTVCVGNVHSAKQRGVWRRIFSGAGTKLCAGFGVDGFIGLRF